MAPSPTARETEPAALATSPQGEGDRASLSLLSPAQDEAILRDAGFPDVELFYAAFTWRGWVARA